MTVFELIEALSKFDPDMPVHVNEDGRYFPLRSVALEEKESWREGPDFFVLVSA